MSLLIPNKDEIVKGNFEDNLSYVPTPSKWIFDQSVIINQTPSRLNKINIEDELDLRKKGTTFLRDLHQLLDMKSIFLETAYIHFHRFFMFNSFHDNDPIEIAMACYSLASDIQQDDSKIKCLIQLSFLLKEVYSKLMSDWQIKNHILNFQIQNFEILQPYHDSFNDMYFNLSKNYDKLMKTLEIEPPVFYSSKIVLKHYFNEPLIPGDDQSFRNVVLTVAFEMYRFTTLCLEYDDRINISVAIYLASFYTSTQIKEEWHKCIITDEELNQVVTISQYWRDKLLDSCLIRHLLSENILNDYCAIYEPQVFF